MSGRIPDLGETVLFHVEKTDDWMEATVREVGRWPQESGPIVLRLSVPGQFHDVWVPLDNVEYDGKPSGV